MCFCFYLLFLFCVIFVFIVVFPICICLNLDDLGLVIVDMSFSFACDTFTHGFRRHSKFLHFPPLACVDESVFLHVGFLVEPLPAVLTWVRPCVRVDEQVRRKRGRPLKTFTAYFAVKASFLKRKQIDFLSVNSPWLKKERKRNQSDKKMQRWCVNCRMRF